MQKKTSTLGRLNLRSVLSDKNTRNLLFFLVLNLMFAFVELFYGLVTNSLGLISDSFHMFFDCSALLLGLAASIIAKWGPNSKFTYGFGRAEVLTGFANGLFLLFIALFIMKEAIERALEPPEVHHERLFVISVMGFIVNLVGIFVFQHGGQCNHDHSHGHGHHSHSHHHGQSHSHTQSHTHSSHHDHSHSHQHHQFSHFSSPQFDNSIDNQPSSGIVALDMNGTGTSNNNHDPYEHNHDHHDHHNHIDKEPLIQSFLPPLSTASKNERGQIMESVFLHILADTLGSIGVMVSAILMSQFGWLIADAICSLFIAILISISVYPLLRNSVFILMQRVPARLENTLPDCLDKIRKLPGVLDIHDSHFWTLYGNVYVGSLKLEIAHGASHRNVLENTKSYLNQIGVERHHIQIDQI